MACKREVTAEMARQLLDYDPETGAFKWRARSLEMFDDGKHSAAHSCAKWNGKFSGKPAGRINNGYLQISIFNRRYLGHRLAVLIQTGEWPTHTVDHENLDKSDNRWTNLREATKSQNQANHRRRIDNTSGFKGVCWDASRSKWMAYIHFSGKRIHLGHFATPDAAHEAYLAAAEHLFGEFARAA